MLDLRTGKEMTRRETIKGGLGLAAILAAGKAPAYLLGARGVAFGELDAFPYPFKEDLVCCFDGIWNGGIGVHNSSGLVWKDISENGIDATFSSEQSNIEWGDNYGRNLKTSSSPPGTWAFDFTIPANISQRLNDQMSLVFVNGKTSYYATSYCWQILLGLNSVFSGLQNIENGVLYGYGKNNSSKTISGTWNKTVGSNCSLIRYQNKTLKTVKTDDGDLSPNLTGDMSYSTDTTCQIVRNFNCKCYAAMIYSRYLTDEEWIELKTAIKNRFNLN